MNSPTLPDYLNALYPGWTPGALLAYVKDPFIRRFGYASGLPKFADSIRSLDEAGYDVYLTINSLDGAAVQSRGPHARGKEAEVVSVLAMVADVDAAGKEGHRYPPQPRILQTLDDMPLPPSIVVISGRDLGGVHVYWLLAVPFVIRSDADRDLIKRISREWQGLLKAKLAPYELDSTFDLVRVLRPIGTVSKKYGTLVSAFLFQPDRRYRIEDFEAHLPKPAPVRWTPLASVTGNDTIDRAARYIAKISGAIEGQNGSGVAYHVACVLVEGFALSIADALPIMRGWNQTCTPPWSEAELLHKLESADDRAGRRGYMLNQDSFATQDDNRPVLKRLVLSQSESWL
ncbi:MAG: hypothetical protein ACLP9L_10575 [Thermoguttaceae bacterium]